MLQSTGSFGDWGVCLTRPVLESNSSFVWRAVSLTRLVLDSRRSVLCLTRTALETVWSFVGWRVLHTLCPSLPGRSSGAEFLLHAPCWNLFVGIGVFLLFVPYGNLSGTHLGGDFLLHAPCSNLSGLSAGGKTLILALYCKSSHR